jgi:hypothetical protein
MDWLRFPIVVAASSVIASFTDWLFMGVLFHDKYLAHREVWRGEPGDKAGEMRKIIVSQVIGVVSSAAFALLLARHSHRDLAQALMLAVIVWLAGVAPMTAQNVVWMKLHPFIGASHAAAWLTRFLITAILAVFLL